MVEVAYELYIGTRHHSEKHYMEVIGDEVQEEEEWSVVSYTPS